MNHFDKGISAYFTTEQVEAVRKIKVGIAGAGGLGSNCAMNLVRSGFRNFLLCDFDKIEAANLNRQFYFADQIGIFKVDALAENLLRINPSLEIQLVRERIVEDNVAVIFESCNVIVEAFDCASSKRLLAENYAGTGRLFVSASGIAGWGDRDGIVTRRVGKDFYVVGDMRSEVSKQCPPCSPRVNIAAAKQADIVLSWALGKGIVS